ncbi:MAG: 50S ribosomal protein L32 [Parcubacteria group bacterium]|jgi:large subunit ribosomal protein L32
MSVPKQRHTKGRRDRKRARFKIVTKELVACSHCKKMIKQHEACPNCGYYKGKAAIKLADKKVKGKAKKKEQEKPKK